MTVITSLQNERVKLVRALQSSGKTRREENLVALEGVRLVRDVVMAGVAPQVVFYTSELIAGDQAGSRLLHDLESWSIECVEVTGEVMAHMADTETPQGLIAVMPMPDVPMPATTSLALVLDGVADPGNLGTILRTSAAAGVDVVILAPHCVDPHNPKVLRSAMGAHYRVPIVRKFWPDISLEYGSLPTYLADANGKTVYHAVDWTRPAAVIVGGEARGADPRARQLAGTTISIPMSNTTESLNAAVAAGVLLFEIRRQRTADGS